jgi:F0F1-type ATP synthase membrane subunit b/b'
MYRSLLLGLFALTSLLASEGEHGAAASGDPLLPYKLLNFAILATGLGYLFIKFAFPAFRGQQKSIVEGMQQAQRQAEAAEAKARAMDARIANLSQEIEELRKHAAEEMQAEVKRVEADTAAALAKLDERTAQEIAAAAKAAQKALQAHAADLALDLARQKVAARMDSATQNTLVARFVEKLSRERARG